MSIVNPGSEGPAREKAFAVLDAALRTLSERGRAAQVEGRWYAVEHTPWAVGVIDPVDTGDALLRPGYRQEPELFIRRRNLNGALAGDTVLVRRMGRSAKPTDWKLPEGAVLQILAQRHQTL